MNTLLTGNARNEIDLVYGVYFDENGTMLDNKKFDVDTNTIIIHGVRYKGLYELIFKKIPNDAIYEVCSKSIANFVFFQKLFIYS